MIMMPINLPSFKEFCTNSGVALSFHRVFKETPEKQKAHISPCIKCNTCGMQFKRPSHLLGHQKIHNKGLEQPHRCSTCSKRFQRRGDLNRHEKVNNPAVLPFRLMLTFDRPTKPNVLTNVSVGPILNVRIFWKGNLNLQKFRRWHCRRHLADIRTGTKKRVPESDQICSGARHSNYKSLVRDIH
jgi:hypothetical protein